MLKMNSNGAKYLCFHRREYIPESQGLVSCSGYNRLQNKAELLNSISFTYRKLAVKT